MEWKMSYGQKPKEVYWPLMERIHTDKKKNALVFIRVYPSPSEANKIWILVAQPDSSANQSLRETSRVHSLRTSLSWAWWVGPPGPHGTPPSRFVSLRQEPGKPTRGRLRTWGSAQPTGQAMSRMGNHRSE